MTLTRCGYCGGLFAQSVMLGEIRKYAIPQDDGFLVLGKVVACCNACYAKNHAKDKDGHPYDA